ncbi:MAG: hypothetical protein A2Z16_09655 [Chloroflexi bacterium RBG_16_54_18]|nr:MAG: hypothetical protein A2Z16_09655 [Chloroflexi bacterium RBG_16_54_18]
MLEFPFFEIPVWSVNQLTTYLRDLLESDEILQDLWVQGEISNLSRPASGHVYFTLKDRESSLRCVMWRNSTARLRLTLQDGQAVEAHGKIGIYPVSGQYQLYADLIRPVGEGVLYQEFLRLKARLEAEGLFDPSRKRPLPKQPHRIGIVSSPTGAAIRDILNTLQRRYPLVEVILAPTPVQGVEAPAGIIAALDALNRDFNPDVILVARGGGSIEDLWAFNDEGVARAVAASRIPVISGIGHETDFTITDFVSDYRAPTPTAAAEIAVPDRIDLQNNLNSLSQTLTGLIEDRVAGARTRLAQYLSTLQVRSPVSEIRTDRQRVDDISRRLSSMLKHGLEIRGARLAGLSDRLISLSPQATLSRGYAVITQPDGSLLRSIIQLSVGSEVAVRLLDGSFDAAVKTIQPKSDQAHE